MSYDIIETSREDGDPFFLYEFKRGGESFRFCSTAREINASGHIWEPSSISHTSVEQNSNIEKNNVDLTFPVTSEFARQYIGFSGEEVTTLTIWRGHDTSDLRSYWKGRIVSGSATDDAIQVECESVFTSLRRSGVRPRFQRSCRHPLYGPGCNVNMSNHVAEFYVTNLDGPNVEVGVIVPTDPGEDPVNFVPSMYGSGIVEFNGSFRYITGIGSTSFVMATELPSLREAFDEFVAEGLDPVVIKLYPGCNRTRDHCQGRFNNLNNYGGFPGIPIRNPFSSAVI